MTQPLDIILAEDNLIQRSYLTRMIEHLGHRIIPAEDGIEALEKVKSTGAQILISDYKMPNLNGIELTRAVRALNLDHYVHIIMITGNETAEVSAAAIEAGADDFLPKGHDPARLRARICTASRLVHHARELAEQHRVLKEANDRIQEDLNAAASAQRQLLPDIHKDLVGIHVSSAFVPSAVVSGDMFGCFDLGGNRLGLYAVDVSGHGITASLLSVAIGHLITPAFFGTAGFDADGTPNPAALVRNLNHRFCSDLNDNYFTMFCAVIDQNTGRLDLCQAGYPSPLYVSSEGEARFIGDGGFPVGMFADATYENLATTFDEGGLLLVASDAAIEAEDPGARPFGRNRLRDLVGRSHDTDVDLLPEMIVEALRAWRSDKPLEDDLTVVALKRMKTA